MIKKYDICIILDDIVSVFARLSVLLWAEINQKLIFVPDSLKPYDFNKDDERWY